MGSNAWVGFFSICFLKSMKVQVFLHVTWLFPRIHSNLASHLSSCSRSWVWPKESRTMSEVLFLYCIPLISIKVYFWHSLVQNLRPLYFYFFHVRIVFFLPCLIPSSLSLFSLIHFMLLSCLKIKNYLHFMCL